MPILVFIFKAIAWVNRKLRFLVVSIFPIFRPVRLTAANESPVDLAGLFGFLLRNRTGIYWPVHATSTIVGGWRNIHVGIDAAPGISPGCYIQAIGKIHIGDYTQIAPNVGIVSANHFMLDIRKHIISYVSIGKYCRIGMGAIILPGVTLGDFTTVSAGAVVTESFPNGYCVLRGNPAKIVEDYSQNEQIKRKFLRYRNEHEFHGYIRASEFEAFSKRYLLG